MSAWSVSLVSAFGRGQTLALALQDNGFQVKILDFSSAFGEEYRLGVGPFPLVDKCFLPAQQEYLDEGVPVDQGLSFWLKDGPLELTGPFAEIHALTHPEVAVWRSGKSAKDFENFWLRRFLQQWASPFLNDSWMPSQENAFPAEAEMRVVPESREATAQSFARVQSRGVEVLSATSLREVQTQGSRITGLEVETGSTLAVRSDQWVWCLSSAETGALGESAGAKIFKRGVRQAEWVWLSFAGSFKKGPWSSGLPLYSVMMGDIYLPWVYDNATVLRRVDETRLRFWMKVPRNRVGDIDARRTWANDLQLRLRKRLPLADWKVDSGEWSLCPHSPIFSEKQKEEGWATWKNWDWISPETLPRLDISSRLEAESESFHRLVQWRADQQKKKGASGDLSLHAP